MTSQTSLAQAVGFPDRLKDCGPDVLITLREIIGDPAAGVPALVPVSRSTWYAGMASGRYPKGVMLGPRLRMWYYRDIEKLVNGDAE